MNLDSELLEILACPACKASLRVDDPAGELACTNPHCRMAYPVRDDIPVLLVDEARRPGDDQPDAADAGGSDTGTGDTGDIAGQTSQADTGQADRNESNDPSDPSDGDGESTR